MELTANKAFPGKLDTVYSNMLFSLYNMYFDAR